MVSVNNSYCSTGFATFEFRSKLPAWFVRRCSYYVQSNHVLSKSNRYVGIDGRCFSYHLFRVWAKYFAVCMPNNLLVLKESVFHLNDNAIFAFKRPLPNYTSFNTFRLENFIGPKGAAYEVVMKYVYVVNNRYKSYWSQVKVLSQTQSREMKRDRNKRQIQRWRIYLVEQHYTYILFFCKFLVIC